MKTYFYRRASGILVRIECEQMFWSGTACIFVRGGLAAAVIAPLPGEIICEQGIGDEVHIPENSNLKVQ
jgi:hypothetical protein